MKRPGIGTYLIGNPISALAIFGFTAWLTWRWYNGEAPGIAAVIFGFVTMSAFDANGKLNNYRHWQREWDAMGGRASRPAALAGFVSSRTAKVLVGVPLWALAVVATLHVGSDPLGQAAAALFWLGSALIVAVPVYRSVTRRMAAGRTQPARQFPFVTGCVPVPRASPSFDAARAALPDYARF